MVLVFRAVAKATVAMMPNSTLFADFLRHFQAFSLPETIDPFEIHLPALLTKLRRNEAIAITRMFPYELMNPRHEYLLLARVGSMFITLRTTGLLQNATCPALRYAQYLLDVVNGLTPSRRAQKFPFKASFRIDLSSSASANNRFKRLFSSSSSFSRFASSDFIPPY